MISNEVTGSVRYLTNNRCVKWAMLNVFASQFVYTVTQKTFENLTLYGPCIVINLCNKNRDALSF